MEATVGLGEEAAAEAVRIMVAEVEEAAADRRVAVTADAGS
jgi:hypothetical protein